MFVLSGVQIWLNGIFFWRHFSIQILHTQFNFCIPNSNQVCQDKIFIYEIIKPFSDFVWYVLKNFFSEWIWRTWTTYLSFRWAAWKIMTLILQISHFWPAQQRNHHYTILLICCTQNGFKNLFKLLFNVFLDFFYLLFDVFIKQT